MQGTHVEKHYFTFSGLGVKGQGSDPGVRQWQAL